jgi:uncharacterized protein YgbK (DUF1537 family)
MIAVIADDLTGAAELGGIGLRYNLKVEIVTAADVDSTADLLIIATDTRSMHEAQALAKTVQITFALDQIKPDIIFKKVDSVLRGHIINELLVHLELLNLDKAFLVPANPALGRVITDGKYFINDQPIHLTSFVNDPEFPVTSNEVLKILRTDKDKVNVHTTYDILPQSGIIIGECTTNDHLQSWVDKADKNTLLAGGSGLFTALLESLNLKEQIKPVEQLDELTYPALFVCGSTHDESRQSIKKIKAGGGPVSYMPYNIVQAENPTESLFENWADEIVSLLNSNKKAIIAIDAHTTKDITITAADLRNKKALIVDKVFKKIAIKDLLIEGGSTAAAIINRLNINKFSPVKELGPGVIKMKADAYDDLFLTLKPGSYNWPSYIWNF